MDELVAVRVMLDNGESRYFITWGRIQAPVDSSELEGLVLEFSRSCSLGANAVKAELCPTLQEASGELYFYEGLFSFSSTGPIPYGKGYEKWRKERDSRMRDGQEIYYLGVP